MPEFKGAACYYGPPNSDGMQGIGKDQNEPYELYGE